MPAALSRSPTCLGGPDPTYVGCEPPTRLCAGSGGGVRTRRREEGSGGLPPRPAAERGRGRSSRSGAARPPQYGADRACVASWRGMAARAVDGPPRSARPRRCPPRAEPRDSCQAEKELRGWRRRLRGCSRSTWAAPSVGGAALGRKRTLGRTRHVGALRRRNDCRRDRGEVEGRRLAPPPPARRCLRARFPPLAGARALGAGARVERRRRRRHDLLRPPRRGVYVPGLPRRHRGRQPHAPRRRLPRRRHLRLLRGRQLRHRFLHPVGHRGRRCLQLQPVGRRGRQQLQLVDDGARLVDFCAGRDPERPRRLLPAGPPLQLRDHELHELGRHVRPRRAGEPGAQPGHVGLGPLRRHLAVLGQRGQRRQSLPDLHVQGHSRRPREQQRLHPVGLRRQRHRGRHHAVLRLLRRGLPHHDARLQRRGERGAQGPGRGRPRQGGILGQVRLRRFRHQPRDARRGPVGVDELLDAERRVLRRHGRAAFDDLHVLRQRLGRLRHLPLPLGLQRQLPGRGHGGQRLRRCHVGVELQDVHVQRRSQRRAEGARQGHGGPVLQSHLVPQLRLG